MATPDIKYTNKDFSNLKQSLIDYARTYFQNSYMDFSPSAPGNMFIEMSAYVGDVLSFYTDNQLQETLLLYAQERKNIIALAYALGYRPKVTSVSTVDLDVYQLLPSDSTNGYKPDWRYTLKVDSNTSVRSVSNQNITFLTQNIVDFSYSSSLDPTTATIYQYYSGNTNPQYYLLKKSVGAISGTPKTTTFTFGTPEQFSKITLTDNNIIKITNVVDSNGNTWYEVPYLAQDTIYDEIPNDTVNNPAYNTIDNSAPYLLRLKKVPRRFITRFIDDTTLEISFGSGVTSTATENLIPNPNNVGLGLVDSLSKLNAAYDPSNFLFTDEYGLAPSNTTLTVTYIVGGGIESNVPSNDLTIGANVNTYSNGSNLNQGLLNTVINSVKFNNTVAASGGGPGETTDQIRLNTLANFPTQNRNVTKDDYLVRTLSLPSKFGYISKAYVTQDYLVAPDTDKQNFINNNPLALSVYVLSADVNGKMTTASNVIKNNLKTYLAYNKMASDAVLIKNAYYVNIKVSFDITVAPANNGQTVLTDCISALKSYFSIDKWQINQPIILSEVYNTLNKVKGVQSAVKVTIENLAGGNYSQYAYDILGATKAGVIYPSLDPCIFEVRYPDSDIYGRIVTY